MNKKDSDIVKILARNVHDERIRQNLTQQQLAEVTNMTTLAISNIERAEAWPKPETLQVLSQALHIRPYELFLDAEVDTVISKERFNAEIELIIKDLYARQKKVEKSNTDATTSDQNSPFAINHKNK